MQSYHIKSKDSVVGSTFRLDKDGALERRAEGALVWVLALQSWTEMVFIRANMARALKRVTSRHLLSPAGNGQRPTAASRMSPETVALRPVRLSAATLRSSRGPRFEFPLD